MIVLTYAIPDLHGRFDLLEKAYAAVLDHAGGVPGTIVHLGDYIDRGHESRQVVAFLIDDATVPLGWRRICLSGNHEDMMVASAADADYCDRVWLQNGGDTTLVSYGSSYGDTIETGLARLPGQHVAWMAALPRLHVDEHRVYVHAGVDAALPLDAQDHRRVARMRYPDDAVGGHGPRHVVHGHTPKIAGPIVLEGRTNLDTYAWATGRLVVGVFDDDVPGGAATFLEIAGAPADLEDID